MIKDDLEEIIEWESIVQDLTEKLKKSFINGTVDDQNLLIKKIDFVNLQIQTKSNKNSQSNQIKMNDKNKKKFNIPTELKSQSNYIKKEFEIVIPQNINKKEFKNPFKHDKSIKKDTSIDKKEKNEDNNNINEKYSISDLINTKMNKNINICDNTSNSSDESFNNEIINTKSEANDNEINKADKPTDDTKEYYIVENDNIFRFQINKSEIVKGKWVRYLRCADRENCNGTARVSNWGDNDEDVKRKKKCTIDFKQHNYIKEHEYYKSFANNQISIEEMKNKDVQFLYLKYMIDKQRTLKESEYRIRFISEFPSITKIYFGSKDISLIKENIRRQETGPLKFDERLENISDINGKKLKLVSVSGKTSNMKEDYGFKIYADNISLIDISSKDVNQLYWDNTYFACPYGKYSKNIGVLCGFNEITKCIKLGAIVIASHESFELIDEIFAKMSKYAPKLFKKRVFINTDFSRANMNVLQKYFGDDTVITCFFHFSNAIWTNLKKHGLKNKKTIGFAKQLALNL